MKQFKRILLIVGYIPVFIASVFIWIANGKYPLDVMDNFEQFCI